MSESNEQEPKKPLSLARPGRLELKKTVDAGHVRQSFPHGRSKTVQVEVKRKRTYAPGAGGRMTEVVVAPEGSEQAFGISAADLLAAEHAARHLTAGERATRLRALEDARRDE
ncbi:MAG TPA: IF-2-associated domain-containing protein, partial [Dongiaceae bacterium]|nr:IF-2-associated domain-containing protein [Dongiaceae bacterium]